MTNVITMNAPNPPAKMASWPAFHRHQKATPTTVNFPSIKSPRFAMAEGDPCSSTRRRTNPKSSTGRLDIFTRVITDLNFGFDDIRPGYKGPLYLEIVSRSFTINVKTGMSLTQLRLMDERSTLTDDEIFDLHEKDCLLYDFDPQTGDYQKVQRKKLRINEGLFLRVDLHGPPFPSGNPIVGYRAKRNSRPSVYRCPAASCA
ncbi:MAG: 2'-deoxycytidine 5'-triphosphate deaminase [Proteobacteria bacterium]|nr:2'-deoxycytidine 5'-triphosphate deaminase [Pseudomonadota bacterium]